MKKRISLFLVILMTVTVVFGAYAENPEENVVLTDESGQVLTDEEINLGETAAPQEPEETPAPIPTESTPPLVIFSLPTQVPTTAKQWPTPTRTLKYGIIGADVTALQTRLKELGYYNNDITGNYYAMTRDAVNAFQTANGYSITGQASIQLQMLIFSDAAKPKATPTPKPTATPKPTPTPNPTFNPSNPPAFPGNLKVGSSGTHARNIQLRLKELGYYNSSITDYFGTVTQAAVKAFQNNNGLTADGVVGKLTWTKLFADPNARPASATPTPKPTPAPAKYYITIDVVNQIVTVYGQNSRGEHTEVIKRMICSTGTSSHPTPERQYVLNGATARWCYFPAWGTHAQYWTRISSSIAFHSVIYTTPNTMALSTSSYFNLGSPASHGCIRLLVADAKWIYDNCGAGTVVDVIRGKPDPEGTQALKPPALNYNNMLPQATPAPTPTPKYDANALPPQPFRTLEVGSKGEDVFWLQCRLTELGYYTGSITGGYANGTRDAVKAYQKDHGLSQDGKAGRLTQNSIYEYVLYPTPSPTPFTTPTPSPTPFTTPVPVIPPQNPMAAPTPTPVG